MNKNAYIIRIVKVCRASFHGFRSTPVVRGNPTQKRKQSHNHCHKAALSVFQQKHRVWERLGLREQVPSQTEKLLPEVCPDPDAPLPPPPHCHSKNPLYYTENVFILPYSSVSHFEIPAKSSCNHENNNNKKKSISIFHNWDFFLLFCKWMEACPQRALKGRHIQEGFREIF